MVLGCIGEFCHPPVEKIVQPRPEERIACRGQRRYEDGKVDFLVEPVANGVGGRRHLRIRGAHKTSAELTVDDLLNHNGDRRGEPETQRDGDQQERCEGPEAPPQAAPWMSCSLRSCGLRLLGETVLNGGPQLCGNLVLLPGGPEQALQTTMGCHLLLAGG